MDFAEAGVRTIHLAGSGASAIFSGTVEQEINPRAHKTNK